MARTRIRAQIVSAALAAAMSTATAAAPGEFSVGVLRRDGVLIPFASFNGRGWEVVWPGSDQQQTLPIGLADVPKRWWGAPGAGAPWHAWLTKGGKQPLKLLRPAHVPIFCGAHLAITTDYRGEALPEPAPTMPKDGIATAGDVAVLPITEVSANSPDATRMVAEITRQFNVEEALAAGDFTDWRHPFGVMTRTTYPIELEAFYRSTDAAAGKDYRTSYIEAVRRFPALPSEQGCGLITFVRGWVTEDGDKEPHINIGARITYCDRADASFMQPFGRVRIERGPGHDRGGAADIYWIYQISSWRDEFYSVARVAPEGVRPVLVVAGGGCPRESPK